MDDRGFYVKTVFPANSCARRVTCFQKTNSLISAKSSITCLVESDPNCTFLVKFLLKALSGSTYQACKTADAKGEVIGTDQRGDW
jgi:hypothetical protein